MHILLLPSWYPETPEDINGTFFRQQAQALHRHGMQVGVLAVQHRSLRGQPKSVIHGNYGIKIYTEQGIPTFCHRSMQFFPKIPLIDRSRWLNAGERLFQHYIKQYGKPDVLHAHCVNFGGILAHRLQKKYQLPYVITEHSSTYARQLIPTWQRPAMHAAVQTASACLAVSKQFCQQLEQFFPHSHWQYLPNLLNPIFSQEITPTPKDSNIFRFCSVGQLHHHKGMDRVIEAAALLKQHTSNFHIDIVGEGKETSRLHAQVQQLDLNKHIHFHGKLNPQAIQQLMQHSHAFVLASRIETFGVVLIEALSQGIPVIATQNTGPQSIINAQRGLLVPHHAEALACAMQQLMHNIAHYNSTQLRQDCLQEFGEISIVQQLQHIYQHCLSAQTAT